MNINYSSIIKNLLPFIIVVCITYILGSLFYLALPKSGVESNTKKSMNLEYKRFNVKKSYEGEIVKKKVISPVVVKKPEYKLLTSIKLQAVYVMSEDNGWIVISDKTKKTHILSVGEIFKGYKLEKIFIEHVIFVKNRQEYKLVLIKEKKVKYEVNKVSKDNTPEYLESLDGLIDNIIISEDLVTVKRSYLNTYVNNFEKIWKEIAIKEVKDEDGNINGFKVNAISKKSVFKELGLKKNDIIKSINNTNLNSYNDAFIIYKEISKIKNLNIRIIRDNIEMELDYEIK